VKRAKAIANRSILDFSMRKRKTLLTLFLRNRKQDPSDLFICLKIIIICSGYGKCEKNLLLTQFQTVPYLYCMDYIKKKKYTYCGFYKELIP
jgi:hypothetical protein